MERTGERTYERALPRRCLRAGRGQGAQPPPPRPAPPPPLSSSATKSLTDADHFGMIRTAQRRFAPTVIGITRNSDRHQIGMSDRHRRNTQPDWKTAKMIIDRQSTGITTGVCAFSPAGFKKPAPSDSPERMLGRGRLDGADRPVPRAHFWLPRSEEHTSELQSLRHLVCRLLLEK